MSAYFIISPSPLEYNHARPVQRLSIVDPSAPPPLPNAVYFAETTRTQKYSKTGRTLKKPIVTVVPGAAPGTVAWLDFHLYPGGVFIDYARTRVDYLGKGLARRLVEELIRLHGPHLEYDFGQVVHERMGAIVQSLQKKGLNVRYKHMW